MILDRSLSWSWHVNKVLSNDNFNVNLVSTGILWQTFYCLFYPSGFAPLPSVVERPPGHLQYFRIARHQYTHFITSK